MLPACTFARFPPLGLGSVSGFDENLSVSRKGQQHVDQTEIRSGAEKVLHHLNLGIIYYEVYYGWAAGLPQISDVLQL